MTYKEQLQDPRWLAKRREVLQRDNFKCRVPECNSGCELHVHHKRYVYGRMAWDYPLDELVTLCNEHHGSAHGTSPVNGMVKRLANRKEYFRNKYTKMAQKRIGASAQNPPSLQKRL